MAVQQVGAQIARLGRLVRLLRIMKHLRVVKLWKIATLLCSCFGGGAQERAAEARRSLTQQHSEQEQVAAKLGERARPAMNRRTPTHSNTNRHSPPPAGQ